MKLARYGLSVFTALALFAAMPSIATANPGLQVTNAILVAEVSPGQTITHKMQAILAAGDSPMDIVVNVDDLEDIDATYSARSFVSLDKASFHLEPGAPQEITATVRIPSDVGDGGRYAVVSIRQKPSGPGVSVVVAVNVRLYLTVKGSLLIHEGRINKVSAGAAISGKPVDITTTFQNTGNHHFKFKEVVVVSDAQGEVLDTISTPLSPSSVIPSLLGDLKATFIAKGELPLGVYSVKSKVMLEDGTLLDEAKGSFKVEERYVPPPAPAKATITPGSPGRLATADGRISIDFPQGAVIAKAEVSLQNYPLEQLPSPPTGFSQANTCFRIDGLTGLLAKDATVTVRYSGADLDKAGGDPSRLKLSRWDEADRQWTVIKTGLDEVTSSLVAQTNRLSIWALVVTTSAAPPAATAAPPATAPAGVNWPLVTTLIVGIVIVGSLVLFLAARRKGIGK